MSLIVNELLCYAQYYYGNHPRALVGVAIMGFYNEDEVALAKVILHAELESLKVEGLPRLKKRQGDNKKKVECEDIFDLFTLADSVKCKLPTFVAANIKRVLTVEPGELDEFAMANSMAALTSQVELITKRMEAMVNGHEAASRRMDVYEKLLKLDTLSKSASDQASEPPVKTFADCVKSSNAANQSTKVLVKSDIIVRTKGTAVQSNKVKAVPRQPKPKLLQAFVGRMDMATTESDLTEFLSDAGLTVIHCRKLKIPEGKKFTTSAFYVACEDKEDSNTTFYEDSTWPEGAELRDWYTKQ